MQLLLKHTYLLDIDGIKSDLERLWRRYQYILDNPNWDDLNEARAILFLTGRVFCEEIVPGAIKRRLHLLAKPVSEIDFYSAIDNESQNLSLLRSDPLFCQLEELYRLAKEYKNRNANGGYYLDEERFMKLYEQFKPAQDASLKLGYRGKFGADLESFGL